jgi:hypothetical protein
LHRALTASYTVRDLESGADNAQQQMALQYRVGDSGPFTNIPAGYITDATVGGATQALSQSVTLPAAMENQALVELRWMTTNAVGNDEWIGIDDIVIAGGGACDVPTPTPTATATETPVPPTETPTPMATDKPTATPPDNPVPPPADGDANATDTRPGQPIRRP